MNKTAITKKGLTIQEEVTWKEMILPAILGTGMAIGAINLPRLLNTEQYQAEQRLQQLNEQVEAYLQGEEPSLIYQKP